MEKREERIITTDNAGRTCYACGRICEVGETAVFIEDGQKIECVGRSMGSCPAPEPPIFHPLQTSAIYHRRNEYRGGIPLEWTVGEVVKDGEDGLTNAINGLCPECGATITGGRYQWNVAGMVFNLCSQECLDSARAQHQGRLDKLKAAIFSTPEPVSDREDGEAQKKRAQAFAEKFKWYLDQPFYIPSMLIHFYNDELALTPAPTLVSGDAGMEERAKKMVDERTMIDEEVMLVYHWMVLFARQETAYLQACLDTAKLLLVSASHGRPVQQVATDWLDKYYPVPQDKQLQGGEDGN